jgi:hypothetical protein
LEELVLKREASVTSAEALDEIAANYPDAEILSFRKIKEAGVDEQYFIARLRLSAMEEAGPVEEDSDDKLDQILKIVKEILENETTEADTDNVDADAELASMPSLEAEDLSAHERKPLPSPQKPVLPSASQTQMSPIANTLIVKRPADISLRHAKVQLLREFGKQYQIKSIDKVKNIILATLIKTSEEEEVLEGRGTNWKEQQAQLEDMALRNQHYMQQREEAKKRPPTRDVMRQVDSLVKSKKLHPRSRDWIDLMDEAGAHDQHITQMINHLAKLPLNDQEKFVRDNLKAWRRGKKDFPTEIGKGGIDDFEIDPQVKAFVQQILEDLYTLSISESAMEEQNGFYSDTMRNLQTFLKTIRQVHPEDQMGYFQKFFHSEEPKEKTFREYRDELNRSLKSLPQKQPAQAPVMEPAPQQQELLPQGEGSPYQEGTYIDYMWKTYGPQGQNPRPQEWWEKELAEYQQDPQAFEQGWSGQVKNEAMK